MRIVAQNHINVDDECRECGSGPRKNFVPGAGYFRKHAVAWTANERNFELTLHEEKRPDAPVLGFACGRIKPVHMVDLAGVVELIGVKEAYRGRGLAIRMHEFIMKMTALPLVAAYVQTPQGRDLWLRMLSKTKQTNFFVLADGRLSRISSPDEVPESFYRGDATFMIDKVYSGGYRPPDEHVRKGGRPRRVIEHAD
jgi:hypothetical protein